MKKLILILFVLIGFIAKAQFPSQLNPTQFSTGWFKQGWHQADSGHILANRAPNFTPRFPGTTILYQQAGVDSSIHYFNGGRWLKLSQFDSTSLSNRINLKLNISDTIGQWLAQSTRLVDTMYRVNDSTIGYTIKGAARTFQILGGSSGGGGGSGTVTSVGLSLPSAFNVTPSSITTSGTFAVTGAGTSLQYIRGNGTLATTDTGMIPNFHLKVRSLLTGTSPITFNQTTGAIGINNATATGTKGAAAFTGAFSDNGSGLIDILDRVTASSCTNCNITFNSKGIATAFSNGTGPSGASVDTLWRTQGVDSIYFTINSVQHAIKDSSGTSVTLNNIGSGFRILATPAGNFKTVFGSNTILVDSGSNSNALTFKADTSLLATQFDLSQLTGSNGITRSGNDFILNGTLNQSTTINTTASFFINVTGANTGQSLKGTNTSTGAGVMGQSTSGSGVYGLSSSLNGVLGVSTSGTGLVGESTSGEALNVYVLPSSTNSLVPIGRAARFTSGTAANGIGGSFDFYTQSTSGSAQRSNRIGSSWSNATTASRTSILEFYGVNNATEARKAALAGSGQWVWDGYPALTAQVDTTTYKPVAIDGSGNVVKMAGWAGSGGGGSSADVMTNIFKDTSYVPLIVIFGESNASGSAENTCASAGELDVDPKVQIMQQNGSFASLNIGANNNLTGTTGVHGWELELQNLIPTVFNGRTVYLVKAGVGGSSIAQWQYGTGNYDSLVARMNNALSAINALGKIPATIIWYSQGINDAVSGTNANTWAASTLALFSNFRQAYGYVPVIMTQLVGDRVTYPGFDSLDAKILGFAADKSLYIYRVPTPQSPVGASCTDSILSGGIHWQYLGMKAIANRMATIMLDTAGFYWYYNGINNITETSWRTMGNRNIDATSQFIGTLDANNLIFKVNGTEAMRIVASNQRIGIGVISPTKIVDIGGDILVNGITVGLGGGNQSSNIAVGSNALVSNTTGTHNAAIGNLALASNSTAFGNVGIGSQALNAVTTSCCNVAIGFQAGISSTGAGNVLIGTQAGGSGSYSNKFFLSNLATVNLLYGDFSNGHLVVNPGSSPSDDGIGVLQVQGKETLYTVDSSASPANMLWQDPVTKEIKKAAVPSGSATTLYTGDGTLSADRTVTGSGNNLTFNSIFNYRINANSFLLGESTPDAVYSMTISGASNQYLIGYTPVPTVYSKGYGVYIDTNNNAGLAQAVPTTVPLYATGNSAYVQGLQSGGGNYYRVNDISTNTTATISQYWFNIDATSGNVTVTLPAASTAFGGFVGIQYVFRRVDNSGNTVTITRAGSDTINGATTTTLAAQYEVKEIQCVSTSTWAIK